MDMFPDAWPTTQEFQEKTLVLYFASQLHLRPSLQIFILSKF